jgi:hypothetical protein
MAVAPQGSTAIASKARITRPRVASSLCCAMGWRLALPGGLSAARWGGWLALPGGLTLGLFAASVLLHSTPPDEPVRSDTPTVARPITAEPPAEVAAQTDQVQVPSAPTAQMTAREPERQVAKLRAHRTWSATVRKTHLLLSRRGSSMFEPMTWHGGGY